MKKNIQTILAFVALLSGLVIISLASQQRLNLVKRVPRNDGIAAQVPAPQQRSEWNTYRNAELNFKIRYPLGYKAAPQPEAVRFELEQFPQPTSIFYVHFNPDPPNPDKGSISIEIWTNPASLSINQWLEETFPGIQKISEINKRHIAGVDGLQWINNEGALFIETVLPKENKIFWIRLTQPSDQRNSQLENMYHAMLESFVLDRYNP